MNPLLYKAHPLLLLSMDLLVHPAAHSLREGGRVLLIYLLANGLWAFCLRWMLRRVAGIAPAPWLLLLLALPATLLYLPTMLTLLADVVAHHFLWAERFILVFCVFVATQMLASFYAFAIRYGNGSPLGLIDGLSVSLALWLLSLPVCLGLIELERVWQPI